MIWGLRVAVVRVEVANDLGFEGGSGEGGSGEGGIGKGGSGEGGSGKGGSGA